MKKRLYAGLVVIVITSFIIVFTLPVKSEDSGNENINNTEKGSNTVNRGESNVMGSRVLKVEAEAAAEAKPDAALIKFQINTKGDTSYKAQQDNVWIFKKVLKLLKDNGVSREKLVTNSYFLDKHKNGFVLKNKLALEVSLDKLNKILDGLITCGVSMIEDIDFVVKDSSELVNASIKKAVENAKNRADSLLSPLELKPDMVRNVEIKSITRVPDEDDSRFKILSGENYLKGCSILPNKVKIKTRILMEFQF